MDISILYAEDDKATQKFVQLLFAKIDGVSVEYADDGAMALQRYKQKEFDLVISDVNMPKMDGFALIGAIKKIKPQQLFMLVTAMDDKADLIEAIHLRINLFLQKPIKKKEFVDNIEIAKKILQRKREYAHLQQELHKQHQTFEHLLHKQKSLCCITDFKQTTFASDSFLHFFNIKSPQDFDTKYKSLIELFICHPEYICASNLKELLQSYRSKKEGERFVWLKVVNHYYSFLLDLSEYEDGFYMVTLTDISWLKQQKSQLQSEVEQKEMQLQKQKELLAHQAKLASMGEMLDAVAHQWNQPLNIIKMQVGWLNYLKIEGESVKEEIEQTVVKVDAQIEHMHQTLLEFRSFFRPIEKLESIAIGSLLDSVLLLVKDELMSHGIVVSITGEYKAKIDMLPNELKHVFINLLNNSKDAYKDNAIAFEKRFVNIFIEDLDSEVRISYQDSAGGIPSSILQTVFEPNITTKSYGSGIGLYMTKQIVEKIGGSMCVKNYDEGVLFTIKLSKVSMVQ